MLIEFLLNVDHTYTTASQSFPPHFMSTLRKSFQEWKVCRLGSNGHLANCGCTLTSFFSQSPHHSHVPLRTRALRSVSGRTFVYAKDLPSQWTHRRRSQCQCRSHSALFPERRRRLRIPVASMSEWDLSLFRLGLSPTRRQCPVKPFSQAALAHRCGWIRLSTMMMTVGTMSVTATVGETATAIGNAIGTAIGATIPSGGPTLANADRVRGEIASTSVHRSGPGRMTGMPSRTWANRVLA